MTKKPIYNIDIMAEKIETIKKTAIELKNLSGDIQAVDRNVVRILASVKMLEINISDVATIKNKSQV
jgi:hypothetical protein